MKKLLFLIMMIPSLCFTQVSFPYIGGGTSISAGVVTYGAEVGLYNEKLALAIGDEFYQAEEMEDYLSFKSYLKMLGFGDFAYYYYSAIKVHAQSDVDLIFEQGFVVYWTSWGHWLPQVSATTYFAEGTAPFNPATLSLGIGINYAW